MESEAGEPVPLVEEKLLENRCRSIQRVFPSPVATLLCWGGGSGDAHSQNQDRHMSSEVGESPKSKQTHELRGWRIHCVDGGSTV